ncbi:MAG TPA: PIN domain-containing protein [Thermoanaerobaculia bacterium]|nr:PIN domain-containing protein [Thermoanaerobaculia bacterium]
MDEVLIDTNILVYAYQPEEPRKQKLAVEIIEMLGQTGRGRLSAQVLAEFVNSTRSRKPPMLTLPEVQLCVEWFVQSFVVYAVTQFVVFEALRGAREHQLSYYDAQIWSTAMLHQIPTIFTEDFTDGRVVEGVRFVDPFKTSFDLTLWR